MSETPEERKRRDDQIRETSMFATYMIDILYMTSINFALLSIHYDVILVMTKLIESGEKVF